jgi:hypothetical protein
VEGSRIGAPIIGTAVRRTRLHPDLRPRDGVERVEYAVIVAAVRCPIACRWRACSGRRVRGIVLRDGGDLGGGLASDWLERWRVRWTRGN